MSEEEVSLPDTLAETYLYRAAVATARGELSLVAASDQLIAEAEWGDPSDSEINRVDRLIQDLLHSQREAQFAYILAELNLAVCKAVGSPSQEVICANTVGEAISSLKDPRLIPRRIEVYKDALDITELTSDEWRSAILYNNLGNAFSELATGNRQENSQLAIGYFKKALIVFTNETFPVAWASILNNLATVYKSLPTNDDANIQLAIGYWEQALTVVSVESFPYEWANIQRNLGIAHKDLNSGNPVENLTLAVRCLLAALEVFIPEIHPVDWAETQNTLGNVYFRLTTGNRSENLRKAIDCFEAILEVRTAKKFPVQFAATCVNLGNAWLLLTDIDHVESLQKAIIYYEQGLTIYTPQDFPQENAQVHTNLAAAYLYLPAGDRSQNLRRAALSIEMALRVYTRTANPGQYAWVKSTQGAIYQAMATSDSSQAPLAIGCFRAALEVYTPDAFPADYARAMASLGTLYRILTDGDPKDNFSKAQQCYESALVIYRPDVYPDEWAATQTNLGNCFLFWPDHDRRLMWQRAIECYQNALAIHTREAFPLDYARLMDSLGIAYGLLADQAESFLAAAGRYFREAIEAATTIGVRSEVVRIAGNAGSLFWKQKDWTSARSFLSMAINALEDIWGEHYSPTGKSGLQQEHNALYSRLILSCHELAQRRDAYDYVERSRSRYLLSLLGENSQPPATTSPIVRDDLAKLAVVSKDLLSLETVNMMSSLTAEQVLSFIQREEALREEMNQLLDRLASHVPEYVALRHGVPPDFQALKDYLNPIDNSQAQL